MTKIKSLLLLAFISIWGLFLAFGVAGLTGRPTVSAQEAQTTSAAPLLVGLNGDSCQFETIGKALDQASPNSTLYIEHGTYPELLGEIKLSVKLVPAQPGKDCQQEDQDATSASVIITGGNGSDDGTGGLVEITDGATVIFKHMWLRDATATNGGIIAVTNSSYLVLDDALVTDGDASANGGVIYAAGIGSQQSVVHLINDSSVYRGTTAVGDGGGIALFGSRLIVEDGNIGVSSNNGFSTAGNNGGGIYAQNSVIDLSTSGSVVRDNVAGNFGGGIYAENSEVTIDGSNISHNSAEFSGGGIHIEGNSSFSVTNATFDDNKTNTHATNLGGGAIYAYSTNMVIDGSTLTNNSSRNGGGAIHGGLWSRITLQNGTVVANNSSGVSGGGITASRGDVIVDNSHIRDNVAGSKGGGIHVGSDGDITMRNGSTLTNNEAKDGGGVYRLVNSGTGRADFDNVTISGNSATSTSSSSGIGGGGGIYAENIDVTITGVTMSQNSAVFVGGGIYIDGNSSLNITSSTLDSNQTTTNATNTGGGGIYATDANTTLNLDGVNFTNNASANLGGGIAMVLAPSSTIRNATFAGNTGTLGAGIYASANSVHIIDASTFTDNDASSSGGGIYTEFANFTIRDSEFDGNMADNGAGLYGRFNESTLENVKLNSNMARNDGGGIYVDGATVKVTTNLSTCSPLSLAANSYCTEVRGNSAAEEGGGIYVYGSSSASFDALLEIDHAAILRNTASLGGTALFIDETNPSTVAISNTLIADNGTAANNSKTVESRGNSDLSIHSVTIAGNNDSPLWITDSTVKIDLRNSILHQNSEGPMIVAGAAFTHNCNNSQAVSSGGQPMGGSFGNPLFDSSNPRGDYRLSLSSPSIDRCSTGLALDADGGARPAGVSHDQGAFEYSSTQSTPTPTPVNTPTMTPSPTSTNTPTPLPPPTNTPTPGPSPTPTNTPTPGPSPTPTNTPMPTNTATPGPSPTPFAGGFKVLLPIIIR